MSCFDDFRAAARNGSYVGGMFERKSLREGAVRVCGWGSECGSWHWRRGDVDMRIELVG